MVFKHDSIYYEHFYKQLQPWVHYIPFEADLSDLLEKIQWARDHDEEVHHPHSHTHISGSHMNTKYCILKCLLEQTCYQFMLFKLLLFCNAKNLNLP